MVKRSRPPRFTSAAALLAQASPAVRALNSELVTSRVVPGATVAVATPAAAAQAPAKRKGRQPTETELAWMALLAIDPAVRRVVYEGITLRLANGVRYTPDVYVEYVDGTVGLDECKGAFVRDTARVKYEWARQQFAAFRWRWCQLVKGAWSVSTEAGKARLTLVEGGERRRRGNQLP